MDDPHLEHFPAVFFDRADEADDAELHSIITDVWSGRADRYSEIRSKATNRTKIEMSYIGG